MQKILGIGILLLVAFGAYQFVQSYRTKTGIPQTSPLFQMGPSPSQAPFLFQEMTIPYLKNRSYISTLGERTTINETSTYTSYRTSYDSDGLTIYGQLTIPKGTPPTWGFPAVIFIHGYIPPAQYRTFVNYSAYVDSLARSGISVFKIDLRGHDESEGDASGAYYSGDYVIDALNARAALIASRIATPETIGFWGHSMAGNVVFRALAAVPTIPATVIWAGAVYTYEDQLTLGIDDNSYQPPPANTERQQKRQLLRDTHGNFSKESAFWQMVPATNYLDGIQGAVQIHHAANDAVVDVEYSRNLMKILDATPIPHELLEYPSGGHNMTGASYTQAMDRTIDFFKQQLRN